MDKVSKGLKWHSARAAATIPRQLFKLADPLDQWLEVAASINLDLLDQLDNVHSQLPRRDDLGSHRLIAGP